MQNIRCDIVRIIVIIAILRRIDAILLDFLVAHKVCLQSLIKLIERIFVIIKDKLFDSCHRVGIGAQTSPYNTWTIVVHGATRRNIPAAFHAAFKHDGHQRLRRNLASNTLRDNSGNIGPLRDVLNGLFNRCIKLFEGLVLRKIAKVWSNLLAIPQVNAVVKGKLNAHRPLRIRGGGPLIQAARLLRLNATHHAVVTRVFNRNTLSKHHLDVGVIKVASGEAHARTNKINDLAHVALG